MGITSRQSWRGDAILLLVSILPGSPALARSSAFYVGQQQTLLMEMIMYSNKLVLLIILSIFANDAWARPDIRACWERVSKDAAYYPMKVDKETTIIGTMCREENNRPIYIYQNQLTVGKDSISTKMLSQQKVQSLRMACSDPNILPLLRLIDMEYAYYDSKGTYIGRYTLHIENCK